MSAAGFVGRLSVSALIAMLALSLLPPFWRFTSIAIVVGTIAWAAFEASRTQLPSAPRVTGRLRRKRRTTELDAFGHRVPR